MARELSRVPSLQHIKWILPNAPVQPVTLNAGMPMPSWFDIRSLDANPTSREEDEEGMMKSVGTITNLVKAEVDAGIRSERVVVGGFSQGDSMRLRLPLHADRSDDAAGAVIALLTGLTSPLKLGGIVSLSGFLGLSDKARELQVSHAKEYEVFWGHGTSDQVVRYVVERRSPESPSRRCPIDQYRRLVVAESLSLDSLNCLQICMGPSFRREAEGTWLGQNPLRVLSS